jgi:TRAP-type mannitol/chloroaromatic compound transport system permease small subunit
MTALPAFVRTIDRCNEAIGRWVSWAVIAMVLLQFLVVALQESIVYLHGLLFLVAAGYTLLRDGHVRVDIFYRSAPPRQKALVDLLGTLLFLLPVCVLLWVVSWPYVAASWSVLEGSKETSGIQGVYLLKSAILVFVLLVALQGFSLAARSALILLGAELPTAARQDESGRP